MSGKPLAGVIQLFADERKLMLKADAKVMGDFEREAVEGLDGYHGYTHKEKAPGIKGTVTLPDDVTLPDLRAMEGITVQFDRPGQKTVILYNATEMGGHEVDLSTSSVPVEFRGERLEYL